MAQSPCMQLCVSRNSKVGFINLQTDAPVSELLVDKKTDIATQSGLHLNPSVWATTSFDFSVIWPFDSVSLRNDIVCPPKTPGILTQHNTFYFPKGQLGCSLTCPTASLSLKERGRVITQEFLNIEKKKEEITH